MRKEITELKDFCDICEDKWEVGELFKCDSCGSEVCLYCHIVYSRTRMGKKVKRKLDIKWKSRLIFCSACIPEEVKIENEKTK